MAGPAVSVEPGLGKMVLSDAGSWRPVGQVSDHASFAGLAGHDGGGLLGGLLGEFGQDAGVGVGGEGDG